ncbi:hypothetical protein [Bosea sp. (in: a-proteobacteria)]|uniref:hypothetical protein n=1 Tax=Bosea sp. (in: a-proteobacteria) TaxID=1871050 RepID=UPI0025BE37E9|nr:hypothetical protein [Bosea sp. (in: a-proteobacteria)]
MEGILGFILLLGGATFAGGYLAGVVYRCRPAGWRGALIGTLAGLMVLSGLAAAGIAGLFAGLAIFMGYGALHAGMGYVGFRLSQSFDCSRLAVR